MRRLAAVPLLAVVVLLSGCVMVPPGFPFGAGGDRDRDRDGDGSRNDDHSLVCADGEDIAIEGADREVEVSGDCGEVAVRGNRIDVELASAQSIEIYGAENEVSLDGPLESLVIRGNDNSADADAIDDVQISGDRNGVDADTIESVQIGGNDNTVETDRPGPEFDDQGDRNSLDLD